MTLAELLAAMQLPFVQRGIITILVLAVAAAFVGLFISFRSMEFVTDGLVHAVFPGLVIGYVVGGSAGIMPGALIAALITALVLTLLEQRQKLASDAAVAVLLTSAFSLGIVIVSQQESYVSQLESLLFGHLLTVTDTQLWQLIVVAGVATLIVILTWRRQLYRAHDLRGFRVAGFSVFKTDLLLSIAISMLVVAGVQALGNLLVIALLIVPMAVARQLVSKLFLLVPVAALVTAIAGFGGLTASVWASFSHGVNLSAGAAVVLLLLLIYGLVLLGRIPSALRRSRPSAVSATHAATPATHNVAGADARGSAPAATPGEVAP